MSTTSMLTLASAIHSADTASDDELPVLRDQQFQAARDVQRITVQQGAAAIQSTVAAAAPALNTEAARVQASKPKQADALTKTAALLRAVAQTAVNINAQMSKGKSFLEAALDVTLTSLPTGERSIPALASALQIAKQVVTFSKNPSLYAASSLVKACAAQLGKYTASPLASLASQVLLPVVAQALTIQGDVQRGRQEAFQTGVQALSHSATAQASRYKAAASTAKRPSDQGAYLAAATVMSTVGRACSAMQAAVTAGRSLNDVLTDAGLCPDLPSPLTFAAGRLALATASQADDPDAAPRKILARMVDVGDTALFGRDVSLAVIGAAVQAADTSTSKYLSGALMAAGKLMGAQHVQRQEDRYARP